MHRQEQEAFVDRIPPRWRNTLDDVLGKSRTGLVLDALRSPEDIMKPDVLASMKACNFSVSRLLLTKMADEKWQIGPRSIHHDPDGNGHLVYDVTASGQSYTFIVRTAWEGQERPGRRMDATADFVAMLVKGQADDELIERELAALGIPNWEGRTDSISFGVTAANRSQRHFDLVLSALVLGEQPDLAEMAAGGAYILRNAGFYGNGRAGSASWIGQDRNGPFSAPYYLDLFLLYLWRQVGFDYIESLASMKSPTSVKLDENSKRFIGIGNSSGLGMTAMLVRWPQWVGAWCLSRELLLAYAMTDADEACARLLPDFIERLLHCALYYEQTIGPTHALRSHDELAADLRRAVERFRGSPMRGWAEIAKWSVNNLCRDAAEQVNAAIIDCYPQLILPLQDVVNDEMRRQRAIDPFMPVTDLIALSRRDYDWSFGIDRSHPHSSWYFWYHSEEAAEQRRGERYVDSGAEFETFVDVAGAVQACIEAASGPHNESLRVGEFLLLHPEHAHATSRVQFLSDIPYGEIQGNLIDKEFLPVKLIRFLLSVFGFESGAPRSVQWVQGTIFQGAPLPQEIAAGINSRSTMPLVYEGA